MIGAYFLLTYTLTVTLDSLANANYGALFPDLFNNDEIRATTNAIRQAFQLVAMIISITLTPLVVSKIGYPNTALIYGMLGAATIWAMLIKKYTLIPVWRTALMK